jgi:hypothetical protein
MFYSLPFTVKGEAQIWYLKHRLRLFENSVLRKIFGPERDEVTEEWRKLHNGELHVM